MGDPTTVTETSSGTASATNPCTLSPAAADEGLADWKKLLNHNVPADVKTDLITRFGTDAPKPHVYHHITDGTGDCNIDFYALQIFTMPTYEDLSATVPINRPRIPYDAKGLLTWIRTNLNSYMNGGIAQFFSYSGPDDTRWKGSSPLKSVMKFQIKPFGEKTTVDQQTDRKLEKEKPVSAIGAGVVCTEFADDHWIFTTTWTKDTGNHPVCGYRQFGIATLKPSEILHSRYCNINFTNRDKDVLYFYTRGVDRMSSAAFFAGTPPEKIFIGGHNCWKAFIENIYLWIMQNGGVSSPAGYVSKREDWKAIKNSTAWEKTTP